MSQRGRPSLYDEPATRLRATVPRSLNERVRAAGVSSKQIATVLEDFLDQDDHFGLVAKQEATAELARKKMREAYALKRQLQTTRTELGNIKRAVQQTYRAATGTSRREMLSLWRRVKDELADVDGMAATVEDRLRRMREANLAMAVAK